MSAPDIRLSLVDSWEEAQQLWTWIQEPRPWLGIDTETGGLDWWRDPLRLVTIGDYDHGWAVPWTRWAGLVKQIIEAYEQPIAMHNSKFDLHFLEHNGVKLKRHLVHDTMPMTGLLEPDKPKGLKPASERHVFRGAANGGRMLQSVFSKNKWNWATVPIECPEYWSYGALDSVLTARLAGNRYPKIQESPAHNAYLYEVAVAQVLCDMERRGILLDIEHVQQQSSLLDIEEDKLYLFFQKDLGVSNPLSDRMLIKWFEGMGYEFTEFSDKGQTKLDKDVLKALIVDRPDLAEIAKAVMRLRTYHRNNTTYFKAFLELKDQNHRLHTSINPMEAVTGRMSSERPNLQNVPARVDGKQVRSSFIAMPGHKLISADFDQIEYRIMVSRANETRLIEAINQGYDLHTYMAAIAYRIRYEDVTYAQRSLMKNATFAFLYGAGDAKFAKMVGITIDEAKEFRALYEQEFPSIAMYSSQMDLVAHGGQPFHTEYLGRPQFVPSGEGTYKLLNYVTQGEAGDVLKKKMVDLSMSEVGEFMILPIHDEILFEVPEEIAENAVEIIKDVMPEMDRFQVPITVGADILDTWGDKYS